MVVVALIGVDVPVKIVCSFLTLPLFISKAFIISDFLFVDVTLIVASGGRAMFAPISHANPAKVVITLSAGHVIATLIFLNVRLTVRACLGIGHDPCRVLTLSALFFNPKLTPITGAWIVRIETALEAELYATVAFDDLQISGFLSALTRELTLDVRAPSDGGVLVSERLD